MSCWPDGEVVSLKLLFAASAVTCALICAAPAGAAGTRGSVVYPVSEIRGLAAATHPGVLLPTLLPPKVAFADISGGCSSLGVGGPPCFASLHYTTRRTGCCGAFQLALYNGRVASKVVRALQRHDGKYGTASHFRAGRFAGTRQRQWDKRYKVGGVDAYVWQYKAFTYTLMVRFLDSGAQAFPGTVPSSIIASFASVAGAKPPPLPPAPADVIMPDLVGLTVADAIAAGYKAGVDVRRINEVPAPTPEQVDRVVSSSPAAGAAVPMGTLVTIDVGTA